VGRFAPSPSGDLHVGSLYTAAASYLDAGAHHGRWLLRMEDLDAPRTVPGAAARILRTLEAFGFEWHGTVLYQSTRLRRYDAVLESLEAAGSTYACTCSRAQLADEERYPGTCRAKPAPSGAAATRLMVESRRIQFADRIQGVFRQDVAAAVGDLTLRRRDGIVAYLLAVVIDDAEQQVTHVVRGADLLDNTPRQIYLQQVLGLPTPSYAHVPLLMEPSGLKLAKSARSIRIETDSAERQLIAVFALLNLAPPADLCSAKLDEIWAWGRSAWRIANIPQRLAIRLDPKAASFCGF
jgi:glutamyl-Q tRNA(Asp) synthetase